MIRDLEREAEMERLARVLGTDTDRLTPLAEAEPEDLRTLSDAIADHLHERHAGAFEKSIAVAGKLPSAMTAKLAQHAMGPTLSARAATLLEPKQAADLAKRLPPLFLADVAVHLDLRRAGPLIDGIPPEVMAETGAELARRGEWVVLGTFVGHVDREVLAELLDAFDAEALLRAGFFVDEPQRFAAIIGSLSDARLDELLATAAAQDLWPQAFVMFGHLGPRHAARVTDALDRMDEDARTTLDPDLEGELRARASA